MKIKDFIKKIFSNSVSDLPVEADAEDIEIFNSVLPYTMTSRNRIWAVLSATKYIIQNNLEGDFVECGVWRGGSCMAMASQLTRFSDVGRNIWLYDTFSGMTEPGTEDVDNKTGHFAIDIMKKERISSTSEWCAASLEDVRNNMYSTDYPQEKIRFIKGDIVKLLDENYPEKIALLRLDTDWYESTKRELEVLYPRLVKGGVCIIDDYGYWKGAKKAVDEYLEKHNINILLNVIDSTGRLFIKT